MSKFVLNSNSVFTLGGNSFACLLSGDFSESVDTILSSCVGDGYKETIYSLKTATLTVSGELETDDVTAINDFDIGTSGAVVFQPNGTTVGDIKISSTNGVVVSRDISVSSSGLATLSATINLDDVTIAANT